MLLGNQEIAELKEAVTALKTGSVFRLGRHSFTVKNCQEKFADKLLTVLPVDDKNPNDADVIEINTGCSQHVIDLLTTAAALEEKALAIDGACVESPSGVSVLISGGPLSGRSSLAMSLAIGSDWHVICERTVFVDTAEDLMIPFAAPFFIRADAAELVEQVIGREVERFMPIWSPKKRTIRERDSWYPTKQFALATAKPARFDIAIYVEAFDENSAGLLAVNEVPMGQLLRRLLSTSNMLWKEGSVDKLEQYLQTTKCFILSGGTLRERSDFVIKSSSGVRKASIETCGAHSV